MGAAAKKKVLVALSGGIDSAVSAYLLQQQGYQVEAAFMKNWSSTAGLKVAECPWLQDRQDALRVAAFLGIPLHTVDFEREYGARVLADFFSEYERGRTPNPDVACNREIKFGLLYDWARKRGFGYLATGHYARTGKRGTGAGGSWELRRSKDAFKDQTYFMYEIERSQLPHVLFPVGGMLKDEVKELAERAGLPNAGRKESMGLCFVGKVRLKAFLNQKIKDRPGPIVNQSGGKVGEHRGLFSYTVGQREGIGNIPGGPYFVTKKDTRKNVLYVTNDPKDPALFATSIVLKKMHWITKPSRFPFPCTARYRHQGDLVSCAIKRKGRTNVVEFARPQKAVAPGQSVVLYRGQVCLGGGVVRGA